jgi:gamma-glutamyltranspeptidase / glutathione hydrolase
MISPEAAPCSRPSFGTPPGSSNTIYLCVVDGEGNGCSFINSLYMGFGSASSLRGPASCCKIAARASTSIPEHPNALAGGKRPYHTIIPGLRRKTVELWSTFGVMGGDMQPQGHFQVISAMLMTDLNPQEALDRPRWMLADGEVRMDSLLLLEEGIPVKTMARLAELGHRIQPVSGEGAACSAAGRSSAAMREQGVLYGGSDPRKDGLVAAY